VISLLRRFKDLLGLHVQEAEAHGAMPHDAFHVSAAAAAAVAFVIVQRNHSVAALPHTFRERIASVSDADAERPDLLIDLATLTGAARTALGPDLPAVFSTEAGLVHELVEIGRAHADPVWPLPLWMGYDDELVSRIADLNNVSASPFAGAIIAALFLKRFVSASSRWLHLDLYGWNPKDRPGRPLGAEAQCVRALYQLVRRLYG